MPYAAVLFFVSTLVSQSFGQALTGTISGRVTDPDGKPVPPALVQATNSATGALYKTTSAADGSFTLARLPVGTYDITIPPIGFTFPQYQQKGVSVQAAQTVRVEIHLPWGGNLADLSQFASIPQPKCMKLGESWAKVFTTAKAGWESLSQRLGGPATP